MNLNTLRIFNSGNPYDRFDIICMMFDEILEKNREIFDNEDILTDTYDVSYGNKTDYVVREG